MVKERQKWTKKEQEEDLKRWRTEVRIIDETEQKDE